MEREILFRVVVQHNLVTTLETFESEQNMEIPADNLAVTLQLASKFRDSGNIDGSYVFRSIHSAKDFALVALDFIKKLIEKSEKGLETHNFYSEPTWLNPSLKKKQELSH